MIHDAARLLRGTPHVIGGAAGVIGAGVIGGAAGMMGGAAGMIGAGVMGTLPA